MLPVRNERGISILSFQCSAAKPEEIREGALTSWAHRHVHI
jgi:hypothetical protein